MTQSKSKKTVWQKFRHTMLYSCMFASASLVQAGTNQNVNIDEVPSGLSEQSWENIQAQISAAGSFDSKGTILQSESDRAIQNRFGFSIAMDGDTLVVGAPGKDNIGIPDTRIPQGAVYVFARENGQWVEKTKLISPPKAEFTEILVPFFGSSVALEGDTLVVGAPNIPEEVYEGVGSEKSFIKREKGAVYIYKKNNEGIWELSEKLNATNTGANTYDYDGFGKSVAISGDTIIVGAVGEDSSGHVVNNDAVDSGAVYIFKKVGDDWGSPAYIKAANVGAGDQFGWSVAISGDTAVIGAHLEDGDFSSNLVGPNDSASNAGVAYVYTRNGTTWSSSGYLKAGDAEVDHQLGRSVAISGDSIIAGAVGADDSKGAAYVFTKDNAGIWSQQAKIEADLPEAGAEFGKFVTLSSDTAIIGAYKETNAATGIVKSGAAYIFKRNNGVWDQRDRLETTDPKDTGRFGASIAFSGNTLMISANREDGGVDGDRVGTHESGNGAVYAYDLKDGAGYVVGGTVSGLTGTGLVLQNNLGDDVSISADGGFGFTSLANGDAYSVTVKTQPSGHQGCVVEGGSGTIDGANVDVTVTCVTYERCDATGADGVNLLDLVKTIDIVLSEEQSIINGSNCQDSDNEMNIQDIVAVINVLLAQP